MGGGAEREVTWCEGIEVKHRLGYKNNARGGGRKRKARAAWCDDERKTGLLSRFWTRRAKRERALSSLAVRPNPCRVASSILRASAYWCARESTSRAAISHGESRHRSERAVESESRDCVQPLVHVCWTPAPAHMSVHTFTPARSEGAMCTTEERELFSRKF